MRGRVVSVYSLAFRGAMPLGSVVAGLLVGVMPAPWVLVGERDAAAARRRDRVPPEPPGRGPAALTSLGPRSPVRSSPSRGRPCASRGPCSGRPSSGPRAAGTSGRGCGSASNVARMKAMSRMRGSTVVLTSISAAVCVFGSRKRTASSRGRPRPRPCSRTRPGWSRSAGSRSACFAHSATRSGERRSVVLHEVLRDVREAILLAARRRGVDPRAGVVLGVRRGRGGLVVLDDLLDEAPVRPEVDVLDLVHPHRAVDPHLGLEPPLVVREPLALALQALADVRLGRVGVLRGEGHRDQSGEQDRGGERPFHAPHGATPPPEDP